MVATIRPFVHGRGGNFEPRHSRQKTCPSGQAEDGFSRTIRHAGQVAVSWPFSSKFGSIFVPAIVRTRWWADAKFGCGKKRILMASSIVLTRNAFCWFVPKKSGNPERYLMRLDLTWMRSYKLVI